MLERVKSLFDTALTKSWNEHRGGMTHTFGPEGNVLDADRYYWVLAETIAASAVLATCTGDEAYWGWYDRLWAWSWQHLVDTERGSWYRILNEENECYGDLKISPSKTDYHPLGACNEVIKTSKLGES